MALSVTAATSRTFAEKMTMIPEWHFDEFKQVGRDYTTAKEVEIYDSTHAQFRDVLAEAADTLSRISLPPGSTIADIGCGTGAFPIEAAKAGFIVHAADVSKPMLDYAREKAGSLPITFHNAGFLTLELPDESLDAITTTFAFHHLPDFWKGIALKRLAAMLEPSGQLFIKDVVLEEADALQNIAQLVAHQESVGGDFLREDVEGHFREENSTYDWVMEELLRRAGFVIKHKEMEGGVVATYHCIKYQTKQDMGGKRTTPPRVGD